MSRNSITFGAAVFGIVTGSILSVAGCGGKDKAAHHGDDHHDTAKADDHEELAEDGHGHDAKDSHGKADADHESHGSHGSADKHGSGTHGSDAKHGKADAHGGDKHGAKDAHGGGKHGAAKHAGPDESGLLEVELGEFAVTQRREENDTFLMIRFKMYGVIDYEQRNKFEKLLGERKQRMRENIITIVQGADEEQLCDPSLGWLKSEIVPSINKMFKARLLKDVVFSDFAVLQN